LYVTTLPIIYNVGCKIKCSIHCEFSL